MTFPTAQMLASRALSRISRANTAVILGDSITEHNGGPGSTTPTQFNATGHFVLANAIMGHPLTLLNNGGVSSETSTQILARVGMAVLAYSPGYCIVLAGQNDAANAIANATTISNLTAIYDALRANGVFVVCCSLWYTTGDSSAIKADKNIINRAIRAYAETHNGCAYADFALAIGSPADGAPRTNALSDGVHPAPFGAMLMARCLAEVLTPLVSGINTGMASELSHLNYAPNPFAQGDNASGTAGTVLTTGFTGTAPNAWTTVRRNTGTGVTSQQARSGSWRNDPFGRVVASFTAINDGAGFMFGGDDVNAKGRYDQTRANSTAYTYGDRKKPASPNGFHYFCITPGTSAASEPTMTATDGATVTDGSVTWMARRTPTAGDVFYAEVDLAFSGLTNGACPTLNLDCIDTTATYVATVKAPYKDLTGSTDGFPDYLPPTMRLRTPLMTIPSFGGNALRYLRGTILAYGQAGGGVTMDVARASIIRVSP